MTAALSQIPAARRRRAVAILGLFAALFAAVGVLALTGGPDVVVLVFAIVALAAAAVLGLIAWGVLHSLRLDAAIAAEAGLDAAIEQALADSGANSCEHDGSGSDCAHNCDTCTLAALRADG